MAKKPTTAAAPASDADRIAAELAKLIGENDDSATVTQFLSTGYPELDVALSSTYDGGFPVGRIVELAGPPSSGKTAIATCAMADAQRQGGIAMFMDHERSFSERLAPGLGLDLARGRWVYKKPRTYEEALTTVITAAQHIRRNKLIPDSAPICAVFDSLASQVPASVFYDKDGKERPIDKRSMHDNTALARATSASMPAFALFCEELGICAIFLNQVRMKLGVMYGDPRTTPGGESPKFYASVRLMLGASQIKDKKTGQVLGTQIKASIIKNKVGRPYLGAEWRFVFQPDGTGRFDVERSTVEFLMREKVLTLKTTGRIEIDGKDLTPEQIARSYTMEQLRKLLPANYQPPVLADVAALAAEGAVDGPPVEETESV